MIYIYLMYFFISCAFRDFVGWGDDFWLPYYSSFMFAIALYLYIKRCTNISVDLVSIRLDKF